MQPESVQGVKRRHTSFSSGGWVKREQHCCEPQRRKAAKKANLFLRDVREGSFRGGKEVWMQWKDQEAGEALDGILYLWEISSKETRAVELTKRKKNLFPWHSESGKQEECGHLSILCHTSKYSREFLINVGRRRNRLPFKEVNSRAPLRRELDRFRAGVVSCW